MKTPNIRHGDRFLTMNSTPTMRFLTMRHIDVTTLLFSILVCVSRAGNPDMMLHSFQIEHDGSLDSNYNRTNPWLVNERLKQYKRLFHEQTKEQQKQRRRATAKSVLNKLPKTPQGKLEKLDAAEVERLQSQNRHLNWFSGNGGSNAYSNGVYVDPSQYYDKWAQAYRMLGGFIDCDHDKSEDSHDSGDNYNNDGGNTACSRWMLWAAYVNPNYQGNEYYEYFGDNPTSVLDCHRSDTDWELLGVYRQEFYQFIEQISKHVWAIDEYEYVVAVAGLSYMTDYECFYVGKDNSGNYIYASVAPKEYGKFEIALYTDGGYCLTPNDSLGMTYDDFGYGSDVKMNSGDQGGDDDNYGDISSWWYSAQEYTLTDLNNVYEEFKYCTSCVDYPTYQDGYFIGDYGTDDDDLINQCWKFYSHDSYSCEAECIAMAHAQGTILSVKFGDTIFGKTISGFYGSRSDGETSFAESKFSRYLANTFLTISFILFVATFLAFAVARRSRYRERRSSRSRRLLEDDKSRKSRRSKSRSRHAEDDGLFKSSRSSKSRSKSKSRRSKSRSKSGYDAPSHSTKRSSSKSNPGFT